MGRRTGYRSYLHRDVLGIKLGGFVSILPLLAKFRAMHRIGFAETPPPKRVMLEVKDKNQGT
jgi:hypothetical protein